MSQFGDDIKALRILLAEQGIEVTLDRLLDVLEKNLNTYEDRGCYQCQTADFGLCFQCLLKLVKEEE